MTAAEIAQTLATLNASMTADRPTVATSGCTDPRCTCCTGGKR